MQKNHDINLTFFKISTTVTNHQHWNAIWHYSKEQIEYLYIVDRRYRAFGWFKTKEKSLLHLILIISSLLRLLFWRSDFENHRTILIEMFLEQCCLLIQLTVIKILPIRHCYSKLLMKILLIIDIDTTL